MNPCSESLKQAREKLNLSLEDISIATKINVKFLQAIEEGDFNFLNQVYVRAFIRSFAKQVGLDPEDCIKKYEQSTLPDEVQLASQKPAEVTVPVAGVRFPEKKSINQSTVLVVISIVIILALILILNIFEKKDTISEDELSFQEAVENLERRQVQDEVTKQDSLPGVAAFSEAGDSLILFISAIETSWISVLIDNKYKNEILLMPNNSVRWKASANFKLTTGNAGALVIKLNNKTIPSLGKRGEVIRDVNLSRKDLE